ncbi:hypothetical protein DB347_16705 [Opitutaceae bacterium EW11]|nr:hypothetical protein DB347_16705 [Opitutaceae bacterium EW11]
MNRRRIALLLFAALLIPILPWLAVGQPMENWITGAISAQATLSRGTVALLGIGLLAGDSFLPVPSTFVMSGLGLALGILLGGLLSSAGVFLSGFIAYTACRRFGVGFARRIAGEEGLARVEEAMNRLGPVVIAATRSVPVVQEASACLAGLVHMSRRAFVTSLAAGSLPTGFAYAAIGASALQNRNLAIVLSIAVPALSWPIIWWTIRRANAKAAARQA